MLRIKQVFHRKWAIFLFFFVLVITFKAPILNTPHYWDSLNRVHNANWIKDHSFNPFLEEGEGLLYAQGRPPFFLELLAVSWTLFGNSLIVSHSVVVLFSFFGVLFTYLLGELLFSARIGLFSSLILFFSPLYFAQSGILNYAIPLTALSMMVVYFALKENKKGYLVCASCLVLTKDTGILILIPVVLVILLRYHKKPELYKNIFIYCFPFLLYLLWLLSCRIYHGWFLFPGHARILNFSNIPLLYLTFKSRVFQLFFQNYHWILTLFIMMSIVKWMKNYRQEIETSIFIFGGIAVYILFFTLYTVELERYLLPVFPLFFILFFKSVDRLFKENWKFSGIAFLVIVALFVLNWTGHRSVFGHKLETNMEYLDFIKVHQKAAKFIEDNFPDKHILTDWPQAMELRYPFEGYVSKSIRASSIFEEYNLKEVDLIYFVPQSVKEFINLKEELELTSLARFERRGKAAEIYMLHGVKATE